jgi:hypothetical protein
VCTKEDPGGCPSTEYCKLRIPVLTFDNECRQKKGPDKSCLHGKECISGECKLGLTGPRCT